MKRVVITGLGVATPAGNSKEELWQSLTDGRAAITEATSFDPGGLQCRRVAEVKDIEGLAFPGRKTLWMITRSIALGYAAASRSLDDAGLGGAPQIRSQAGVVFGSTLGGLTPLMRMDRQATEQGPRYTDPLLFPSVLPSAPGCQVSITGGMPTFNTTVSNGQTSGLDAIHYACHSIRSGRAAVVLAGAVEEISFDIVKTCETSRLLAGSRKQTD